MENAREKTTKPSSPKEFFAKLYGHLEKKITSGKPNDTLSGRKEIFQISADQQISAFQMDLMGKYKLNHTVRTNGGRILDSGFPYCKSQSHICSKAAALTAGLTAFLARKRRKEGRPRRQRTTFSNEQTLCLELEYHRNEYISRGKRFELAQRLQLTETQIKIWFQNRRAKDKRIEKAQIDQHYRNLLLGSETRVFTNAHGPACGVCIYKTKMNLK